MRRSRKKQMEELIALMEKAHEEIRKQLAGKNTDIVRQLLGDCQESAIRAGDLIEQSEGEDAPAVRHLEDYCEACYQIYEAAEEKEQNPSGVYRLLQKKLVAAKNSIRQTVTVRLEIAFFCYKASMSDCLESVYFAAKADPSCDAYFVPIPYYDRNPDGSFGQMHYEAEGCYSSAYELTDWKEYDVETRRPDIIYIMSPYDDGNYVTSVHPDFYARRLKRLTDCLVYIPYFVHAEVPAHRMGMTPGVLNSDLTFVQSENIRRYYIDNLVNDNGAGGPSIQDAKKKIVALGSPKMDKLVHMNKADYPLPAGWTEAGGVQIEDKKIVLYNLTIHGSLNAGKGSGENYLKKLRSVLRFFQARKDVILWLRPHPLLGQTLYSMRPWLFKEYEKLIRDYKNAGWGIYDDTPDMDRSVAWADFCYGDFGSVDLLFQFMGKPVLLQNLSNAGKEPASAGRAEEVRCTMDAFVGAGHYNSYMMQEAEDRTLGECLSLVDFLDYQDVVLEYSDRQSEKFRKLYANADGTAGIKIHEYAVAYLRGVKGNE